MSKAKVNKNGLTGVLETLAKEDADGCIKMDDILKTLNSRGFGPLLIAPALIVALPTGAIPGVPAICGVFIFAMSLQLLLGYRRPWMTKYLKNMSFKATRIQKHIERIKPYAKKIDGFTHDRFGVLADSDVSKRFIALATMILGIGMAVVGFIPFVPMLFALPVLFFALGLSVHDGVLLAIGYAMMTFLFCLLVWVISSTDYL